MFINLDGPTFLLLILLAIILAGAIQGKRGRWKRYQYDERQEIVRGRGFQYGFAAMAAALILQAVYTDWLAQFFSYEMLPLLCLCIGILVNTVYIILHDGYFPVNEHPLTVFFLSGCTVFEQSVSNHTCDPDWRVCAGWRGYGRCGLSDFGSNISD